MKILVVEDEPHVAELIQTILEDLGNSVLIAADGAEASAIVERDPVDAITLDLGMPGQSGLDWLEGLAVDHPELANRTLVITGMHLEADKVKRLARCGAGILAKPFSIQTLYDAVKSQLDRPNSGERPR